MKIVNRCIRLHCNSTWPMCDVNDGDGDVDLFNAPYEPSFDDDDDNHTD